MCAPMVDAEIDFVIFRFVPKSDPKWAVLLCTPILARGVNILVCFLTKLNDYTLLRRENMCSSTTSHFGNFWKKFEKKKFFFSKKSHDFFLKFSLSKSWCLRVEMSELKCHTRKRFFEIHRVLMLRLLEEHSEYVGSLSFKFRPILTTSCNFLRRLPKYGPPKATFLPKMMIFREKVVRKTTFFPLKSGVITVRVRQLDVLVSTSFPESLSIIAHFVGCFYTLGSSNFRFSCKSFTKPSKSITFHSKVVQSWVLSLRKAYK